MQFLRFKYFAECQVLDSFWPISWDLAFYFVVISACCIVRFLFTEEPIWSKFPIIDGIVKFMPSWSFILLSHCWLCRSLKSKNKHAPSAEVYNPHQELFIWDPIDIFSKNWRHQCSTKLTTNQSSTYRKWSYHHTSNQGFIGTCRLTLWSMNNRTTKRIKPWMPDLASGLSLSSQPFFSLSPYPHNLVSQGQVSSQYAESTGRAMCRIGHRCRTWCPGSIQQSDQLGPLSSSASTARTFASRTPCSRSQYHWHAPAARGCEFSMDGRHGIREYR